MAQSSFECAPSERPGVTTYLIGGTRFEVPVEYSPIHVIGHGAYGVVCSAVHNPSGTKVAIKKISKAFSNLQDTKRILREIKLLRHFHHENILPIGDIFVPPSKEEFEDIYIVCELLDTDLQQIINSKQSLTDEHCQYFLYQVLRGLKYIHSANVLHRDLKPSNLLINEDCLLKIADFGLARVQDGRFGEMTEYVATRWYRAPEIILSWKKYTKAIDIWSVGCIFAEMMYRKPLFQGNDYVHQIITITDILGTPSIEDINSLGKQQARQFLMNMGYKPPVPWQTLIPNGNPLAFDLIDKMLAFNPAKRITVEEALSHPYLASIRDLDDEPVAEAVFDFDFEKWQLSKEVYQELVFQEILAFHPEAANLPNSRNDPGSESQLLLLQQQQQQLQQQQQQQHQLQQLQLQSMHEQQQEQQRHSHFQQQQMFDHLPHLTAPQHMELNSPSMMFGDSPTVNPFDSPSYREEPPVFHM